jgi:hypothetical protein
MTTRQRAILTGGVVTGVLSTSYLSFVNVACCLGVIIGGVVTVQQYTQHSGTGLDSGDGAMMGALSGALGAVLGTVMDRILKPLSLDSNTISRQLMEEWGQGMGGQPGMSPEMMQSMEGQGTFLFVVAGTVFLMILYAIFGAIGGALGTSFFSGADGEGAAGAENVAT